MALLILDFITYTLALSGALWFIAPDNGRILQWLEKHVDPVGAGIMINVLAAVLTYIRHAA